MYSDNVNINSYIYFNYFCNSILHNMKYNNMILPPIKQIIHEYHPSRKKKSYSQNTRIT